ncbi:DUF2946 family protein [Polymorphobacter sp.]|uniref:DUF2946 family protein n=1 Tax=Polymorphobacter sp. TaxID=1909290 RepID=UPI003F72B4A3
MPVQTALRHIGISLGLAAALLALWMRLLMPTGWMPVATADGVTYIMCGTSMGVIDPSTPDMPHPDPDPSDHCGFASVTPGLSAPPLLLPMPVLLPAVALTALPSLRRPGQMLAWLRPPLRGPPAR